MSYVPPHRRKGSSNAATKDTATANANNEGGVLVFVSDLNYALNDFGVISNRNELVPKLESLASAVGLVGEEAVIGDVPTDFITPDKKNKRFYFAVLGRDEANEVAGLFNAFFRRISTHVGETRVRNMLEQEVVKTKLSTLPGNALPAPANAGAFGFIAIVVPSRVSNFIEARGAVNNAEPSPAVGATSLTLFRRLADGERPTHVLTAFNPQKRSRELVGGGHLNPFDPTPVEGARRQLYEETYGLVAALPGGLPAQPAFVCRVKMVHQPHPYAINYAMVVTDDEHGAVENFSRTVNEVASELKTQFENNPLSTVYPEHEDYQWTQVGDTEDELIPRLYSSLKGSWKKLHKVVVQNYSRFDTNRPPY